MKKLIIYGASELAKLALYYINRETELKVSAFVVDDEFLASQQFLGLPVFSWKKAEEQFPPLQTSVFVAIGYRSMSGRAKAFEVVQNKGFSFINLISKKTFIADDIKLGRNNFVMPGAVIEPYTQLGDNNVIWSNATICHDSKIGNHNFFAANVTLGGHANVGDRCFFGFSSTIKEEIQVGDDVLVGANSLVLKDVSEGLKIYGSPAKSVRSL